jgi:hypothetical protein
MKQKDEDELRKRLKNQELEKSKKEDLWTQEQKRRDAVDKAWDLESISPRAEKAIQYAEKDQLEKESNVNISTLEQTILKVQQQMAEGTDHVNFEMNMKEKEKKVHEHARQKEMDNLQNISASVKNKQHSNSRPSKAHSPLKIKVRVEMEKPLKSPEKIDKKLAANTIVSLMVPFFKKGKIASREVFKCCAREFTTLMLDSQSTRDPKDGPIPLSRYSKYVADFFTMSSSILTEDEIKLKIGQFKTTLDRKHLS